MLGNLPDIRLWGDIHRGQGNRRDIRYLEDIHWGSLTGRGSRRPCTDRGRGQRLYCRVGGTQGEAPGDGKIPDGVRCPDVRFVTPGDETDLMVGPVPPEKYGGWGVADTH